MNYRHPHDVWFVVRAGGVLRASEELHLSPQTLSGQINLVEERLGKPLLRKAGRGVEPTGASRMVMQFADEISPRPRAGRPVEEFYANSTPRQITRPAVAPITEAARSELFARE